MTPIQQILQKHSTLFNGQVAIFESEFEAVEKEILALPVSHTVGSIDLSVSYNGDGIYVITTSKNVPKDS